MLEEQLDKSRVLAEEQTQQMGWVTDYYKDEMKQLKAQYDVQVGKLKSKLSTSLQQVNILEQNLMEL